MAGPLGSMLGRILQAAGARAAATESSGAAGKVLTGVGPANARAYSSMLAGEIVTRTKATRKVAEREASPEALAMEVTRSRMKRSPTGAELGGTYQAAMKTRAQGIIEATAALIPVKKPSSDASKLFGTLSTLGGVLGKVTAGIIGFGVAIAKAGAHTAENTRQLAKWHGGIAKSVFMLDFQRMQRERAMARDTSRTAQMQLQTLNELEQAWQPMKRSGKNVWNAWITGAQKATAHLLKTINWAAGGFDQEEFERIRKEFGQLQGTQTAWSPIGQALSAYAYPDNPLGRPITVPFNRAPGE